jgi:hypothetical protein
MLIIEVRCGGKDGWRLERRGPGRRDFGHAVPSGKPGGRRVVGYYELLPSRALLSARRRPTRGNECHLRHSWLAGWAETEGSCMHVNVPK